MSERRRRCVPSLCGVRDCCMGDANDALDVIAGTVEGQNTYSASRAHLKPLITSRVASKICAYSAWCSCGAHDMVAGREASDQFGLRPVQRSRCHCSASQEHFLALFRSSKTLSLIPNIRMVSCAITLRFNCACSQYGRWSVIQRCPEPVQSITCHLLVRIVFLVAVASALPSCTSRVCSFCLGGLLLNSERYPRSHVLMCDGVSHAEN